MKKILIGVIVVLALGVGVGGAYLAARAVGERVAVRTSAGDLDELLPRLQGLDELEGVLPFDRQGPLQRYRRPGMMDRYFGGMPYSREMGPGMYNRNRPGITGFAADRITIDDAQAKAEEYAADVADNLRVAEVMEFSENFYAVVLETDTGKGAMELLIDPYGQRVTMEIGPNMMWNAKYGHMSAVAEPSATNTLTMAEAAGAAQKSLDERLPGAVLDTEGIDFYGYYSFDYKVDGKVAGMLSVHGEDGRVWFHNWHGEFISEKEIE